MDVSNPPLFQIRFDPGNYKSVYSVFTNTLHNGIRKTVSTGPFKGRARIFLASGAYAVSVSHGANRNFEVLPNGQILRGGCGLVISEDTISFETAIVEIDPGLHLEPYTVAGIDEERIAGPRRFTVIKCIEGFDYPDEGYSLNLAPGIGIRFNVDSNGEVNLNKFYAGSGTCKGPLLTLRSVSIQIVPENYEGDWAIVGAEANATSGARSVNLVRNVKNYQLFIPDGRLTGNFDIDENGAPSKRVIDIPSGSKNLRFRILDFET